MTDTLTRRALDVEAFLATLAGPGRGVEASVAGLTELWQPPPSPWRLQRAFEAAGADVDEWEAGELQVRLGEELALEDARRDVLPNTAIKDLVAIGCQNRGSGLTVSDDLAARLPLMGLAADVAADLGSLSVVHVDSARIAPYGGAAIRGGCTDSAVVLLSRDLTPLALRLMWIHELSHVLDPRPWGVSEGQAEAFAHELGDRLWESRSEPNSLDEVAPLIGDALLATLDLTWPEASTLDALLEWVIAEVCVA